MQMEKVHYDTLIIGSGFTGLYMLYKVRQLGLTARVFEAGDNVGGTWYWNRYPGARCDIESMEYSYEWDRELQQAWNWPERYSTHSDIRRYLEHVAERHDLRRDIQFNTRIAGAEYSAEGNTWTVTTESGEVFSCTWLIAATGCLSAPNDPDFAGIDQFAGEIYHTGKWPHREVDFSGKRVAVIGTGSSGLQCIPEIARRAAHLTVYQRTPAYAAPAQNHDLSDEDRNRIKANYDAYRAKAKTMFAGAGAGWVESDEPMAALSPEKRREMLELGYKLGGLAFLLMFLEVLADPEANKTMADFLREKIAERVKDPEVAAKLMPRGVLGAKRLCSETHYYETFNRDNVSLVDVRETPIVRLTPEGIETSAGEEAFDVIVFATGYDALTGALTRMDIRGRDGVSIRDKWSHGAETYLGMMVAGFPNLFIPAAGAGSSTVFTNVVKSIEFSVEWVADCLAYLRSRGKTRIEPSQQAEAEWTHHVTDVASMTLLDKAASWYRGANVPGKKQQFLPYIGGFPVWCARCQEVANNGYEGFLLT